MSIVDWKLHDLRVRRHVSLLTRHLLTQPVFLRSEFGSELFA